MRPITCNFCRRVIQAALVVSIVVLGACSGPAQSPTPTGPAVPITQVDGAATLIQATGRSSDLAQTAVLGVGDTLYTRPDTTVTLQLTDGSTLQMGPDSQLTLLLIREEDQRPLFRLLKGTVAGQSRSKSFIVQAYLEAAIKFQMVQSDLSVLPHDGDSRFRLGLNDQILDAVVEAGEVDVQSGTQQVTLPAGWQAIVEPQKPFRIVQVITPTPPPAGSAILTPTLIRIITIAPTNTLRPTRTSRATATPTPSRTFTQTPTRRPITQQPATATATTAPATLLPATAEPPSPPEPHPTAEPPTAAPPTAEPPTAAPPTAEPPTAEPPTPRPTL